MRLRKRTAAAAIIGLIVVLLSLLLSHTQWSRSNIPAVVHQMAAGPDRIPIAYTDHVTSWLSVNPGLAYRLWTDSALRRLIQGRYPEAVNWTSSSLRSRLEFSDVSRYFLLLEFGGIYADMDVRARRPLSEYLTGLANLPSNALMACRPGHSFMRYVLQKLPQYLAWYDFGLGLVERSGGGIGDNEKLRRRQGFHANRLTGPIMLHRLLRQYQRRPPCSWQSVSCRVCLMEPEYTMPYADPSQLNHMRALCDTVAKQPVRVPLTSRARVAEFCSEHLEEMLLRAAGAESWVVTEHDFLHLAYTAVDQHNDKGNNASSELWLNLNRLMAQFPGRIELRL